LRVDAVALRLADLVVALHLGFVAFALLGGLLALRWPRACWLQLPAAFWAVLVEWMGWPCPLTPLEVGLRRAAGGSGYAESFLERHALPVLYPAELTQGLQLALGCVALGVNVLVYALVLRRRAARPGRAGTRRSRPSPPSR
jgi:hypothetical protein